MTYLSALTAELLDVDGVTVITDALDLATRPTFMDELDGLGTGKISIGFYDADVTDLVKDRHVRVYSNGVEAFTFVIEGEPEYQQLGEGEEMQEIITASGRGWGVHFEDAIVAPEPLLVGVDLDTAWRTWSFASINFPNAGAWSAAVERYEYQDGITYGARVDSQLDPGADPDDPADDVVKLYPAPIGFPWPNAPKNGNGFAPTAVYDPVYWVTAAGAPSEESIGFHFFRGGFALAGQQAVAFHATGDNLFTMFLDGVPILGEPDDTLIWKGWKEVTLELPAGFHTVAFVVENIDADVTYNPAGALFDAIAVAVYPGDVETSLTLSLLTSGATDLVESFFSADVWPGWSPTQIIRDFVSEVTTRGCFAQLTPTDSFVSATQDTAGATWDSEDPAAAGPYIPLFSLKIGDTGVDLLNALTGMGRLHWHFKPDVYELDGWGGGSAIGATPGVTFSVANGNIRSLQRGQSKPYANALLVQWAKGNTWVIDAAEIAAGTRKELFYATDAGSLDEATSEGTVELQRAIVAAGEAILLEIEPRNSSEAPYEGFGVGDYITIPNKTGGTQLVQVLSITPAEDDEGNAFWRLECNNRWRSPEKEATKLLRSIGGKTYGSVSDHGVPKS